jgi:hypothetical protein
VMKQVVQDLKRPQGLPGTEFQDYLKNGGLLRNMETNSYLMSHAKDLRKALNRAFEDAIPAGHADKGRLADLKGKYSILKKIEGKVQAASPEMLNPQAVHTVAAGKQAVGNAMPQELKTLGEIGKYLPQITTQGALKGAHAGHRVPLWAYLLGGAGIYEMSPQVQQFLHALPVNAVNSSAVLGALAGGYGAAKYGASKLMQHPWVNRQIVEGTLPTLPFSYNPLLAPANQVGTRRNEIK